MVDRIGHYRVVAELGRGGMGIVYKAHEESLNRFVAIKVLGEHLTEDPDHVERFLREARSAAGPTPATAMAGAGPGRTRRCCSIPT